MAENMDDVDEMGTRVELFIYDLSKGMAAMMAQVLIGRHLDGIWHTAIVAYGREYFFGPLGIQSVRPGSTELGEPLKVEKIGETYLPYLVFLEYINALSTEKFAPGTYNLFKQNCNCFSDEVSNFLVGTGIPKYILDLPEEILRTPVGQALAPLVESLSRGASTGCTVGQRFVEPRINREVSPEYELLNTAIEEARLNSIALAEKRNVINEKLAKKERKKKKKKKEKRDKSERRDSESGSNNTSTGTGMSDSDTGSMGGGQAFGNNVESQDAEMLRDDQAEQGEVKRPREPPIVFKSDADLPAEFKTLRRILDGKVNENEITSIEELRQYIVEDEGSWALGDNFLTFVGRILCDKSLEPEVRRTFLNILSVAALKDDVILLLHQDRREHIIMNYAYDIDRHPVEEQLPLATFVANMFENFSSSEWLLYISSWPYQNQTISNIRVTTKVAVHSLLSDSLELQARGIAIIHNLAFKEVKSVVFDDVAVELTMALLQYFNGNPSEEHLYSCMKALARFTQITGPEVPQLIQMIGPEPSKFRGASPRVDEIIDQINIKLRL